MLLLNLLVVDRKSGQIRQNVDIGSEVEIIQKQDQRSGNITEGIVKRILTKSANHPHGIKVILETGEVGRVKWVLMDINLNNSSKE